LASRLMEKEVLDGEEVKKLLNSGINKKETQEKK